MTKRTVNHSSLSHEMSYVGHSLVFSKEEIPTFISEILGVVSLLGEKLIFSSPLGQPKFQQF